MQSTVLVYWQPKNNQIIQKIATGNSVTNQLASLKKKTKWTQREPKPKPTIQFVVQCDAAINTVINNCFLHVMNILHTSMLFLYFWKFIFKQLRLKHKNSNETASSLHVSRKYDDIHSENTYKKCLMLKNIPWVYSLAANCSQHMATMAFHLLLLHYILHQHIIKLLLHSHL